MKVIDAGYTIEDCPGYTDALLRVERAARTAYQSHDLGGTEESAEKVIRRCLTAKPHKHESVVEHVSATVRFVVDRGVMAELTRHRVASFTVESTRYVSYAKARYGEGLAVVRPCFWSEGSPLRHGWEYGCECAERVYLDLIESGATPEQARSVLPMSLKTEVVMTANLREWRHVLRLRTDKAAHPQMREVMVPLLAEFRERLPVFFEDL